MQVAKNFCDDKNGKSDYWYKYCTDASSLYNGNKASDPSTDEKGTNSDNPVQNKDGCDDPTKTQCLDNSKSNNSNSSNNVNNENNTNNNNGNDKGNNGDNKDNVGKQPTDNPNDTNQSDNETAENTQLENNSENN